MKKLLVVVLLVATVLVTASCSIFRECDNCGDLGAGNKIEIFGQELYFCDDCYENPFGF